MISVANILHRSGYLNDAIVATNMALDVPVKLVVSHFTMANLYAAKASLSLKQLHEYVFKKNSK